MDTELAKILGDMNGKLGEIKGTLDSHVAAFDKHVEMDMAAYQAIGKVKDDVARQKGFITGVTAIGTGLSAVVSALVGAYIKHYWSGK